MKCEMCLASAHRPESSARSDAQRLYQNIHHGSFVAAATSSAE
jgi:hypothetical protein